MIEDANPTIAEPGDLTVEYFSDFEGRSYYRVTHRETGVSFGSTDMMEAYRVVNDQVGVGSA